MATNDGHTRASYRKLAGREDDIPRSVLLLPFPKNELKRIKSFCIAQPMQKLG
jgi:hypothetical protein